LWSESSYERDILFEEKDPFLGWEDDGDLFSLFGGKKVSIPPSLHKKEGDVGSKTTCQLSRKGQGAFFLMDPRFFIWIVSLPRIHNESGQSQQLL
jgi:hypothetical protein